MTIWITSDLHFGHSGIIGFCPKTRGHFRDANHMDTEMEYAWNNKVSVEDTVYVIGDMAFHKPDKAVPIIERLNGNKILIEGNHDRKNLKDPAFRACFKEIHKYYELQYGGKTIIMFHYPISEFNGQHRGALHFHGHLHGNVSGLEHWRVMDVSFDATGNIVTQLETAIAHASKGAIKGHH